MASTTTHSAADTGHSANSSTGERQHDTWLEKLARLGYASRGVIYLIIGGLAFLAAFDQGGTTTDSKGAIQKLFEAPGGWLLVAVIAAGLLGYSGWRFCQAAFDADGHGRDAKGIAIRLGFICSAIAHVLLAIWAGQLALGQAVGRSGSDMKESLVASLMSEPLGQWLVAAVGLAVIGAGVAQFAKGHKETFEKHFQWDRSTSSKLMPFCKFGLYARGVVFALAGSFVIYAAITTDPSEAGGIAAALKWLRSQTFGPWLLGITATGLVCFGIYSIVEAIYRRVEIESN